MTEGVAEWNYRPLRCRCLRKCGFEAVNAQALPCQIGGSHLLTKIANPTMGFSVALQSMP